MVLISRILVVITVLASSVIYGQNYFETDKESNTDSEMPQVTSLNGVAQQLYIDNCEFTLTEADFGLHLKVATDENQEVFVHLGPVWATSIWTEGIENQPVHLVVFRYEHLPENEYVVKELHWDGHTAILRDENLMPFWINGYNQGVW